jgi:hypothetical protein
LADFFFFAGFLADLPFLAFFLVAFFLVAFFFWAEISSLLATPSVSFSEEAATGVRLVAPRKPRAAAIASS